MKKITPAKRVDNLVDEGKEGWAQKITQEEPVQDNLSTIRQTLK